MPISSTRPYSSWVGSIANIVFPDVDIEAAASLGVATSIVGLTGQGCAMPTRLLVHDSIYDDMIEHVAQHATAIKLGDPSTPPLIRDPSSTKPPRPESWA